MRIKPRAIVETGVARGGSLIYSASLLELLGNDGIVIGVELEMRAHNRAAVEQHKLANRIKIVEGSSIDPTTVERVAKLIDGKGPVMVFLDSNHTHEHVLAELQLLHAACRRRFLCRRVRYRNRRVSDGYFANRPWGPGNNPRTAVHAFLRENNRFEIDREMEAKILLTCNPDGFLRCVKSP